MMSQTAQLTINNERVNLLSVTGRLDGTGLRELQKQVDLVLDSGARFVVTDLSRVGGCDSRLFDLLTRTSHLVGYRGGWLRVVGPGSCLWGTVDDVGLPAALPIRQAPVRADLVARPA